MNILGKYAISSSIRSLGGETIFRFDTTHINQSRIFSFISNSFKHSRKCVCWVSFPNLTKAISKVVIDLFIYYSNWFYHLKVNFSEYTYCSRHLVCSLISLFIYFRLTVWMLEDLIKVKYALSGRIRTCVPIIVEASVVRRVLYRPIQLSLI